MAVPSSQRPRPRGIRVRTTHTTEAEFISAFHELCDETTVFAPTEKMKPNGAECAFSLELADGAPMVRGLGVIMNAWPTAENPFGRPGIHIQIDQLTTGSEPIFQRLLASHRPRTRPAPSTHQLWGPPSGPPTEEMEAQEFEEPEVAELPQKITRELRRVDAPENLTAEARMLVDGEESQPSIVIKPRPGTMPGIAALPTLPLPAPPITATLPPPIPTRSAQQATAIESSFELDGAIAATRTRPWWANARVGGVFAGGLALGLLMSVAFRSGDSRPAVSAAPPPPAASVVAAAPANCPPPVEPTALAVGAPAESIAPAAPAPTKAQVAAKPKPAAKPTTTTKVAAIAPTRPAATTTVASTKTVTKSTTKPATKLATTKPAKRAKSACSSLDCI